MASELDAGAGMAAAAAVSEAGEVMPQKSTYFYPKIASGIVLNPLDPSESVSPKEAR